MPGWFIAIEGLDGSGSSTQVERLANYLKQRDYKVLMTKEPTNSIIGGSIRSVLTKDWNVGPECLQLLFAADRAHHLEKEILPALEKNYIVISDRYLLSTIAYGALDTDYEWLKKLNERFLLPNSYFILDVPPEICIERMKASRYQLELFEEIEKLKKVRENFLKLSKELSWTSLEVLDGNRLEEDIFDDIKSDLKSPLEKFVKNLDKPAKKE